jgi:hypothetical protein
MKHDGENEDEKYLASDDIAMTFIPPKGWTICSGTCGKPIKGSSNPNDLQCVSSGTCTDEGCQCRLFRGKSNYPENGYTWEHVADQGKWARAEDGYWYLCVCTKPA